MIGELRGMVRMSASSRRADQPRFTRCSAAASRTSDSDRSDWLSSESSRQSTAKASGAA